jgi:predicted ArsR family transcriptional regulator
MQLALELDAPPAMPPPAARRSDPQTSKAAAAQAIELQRHHQCLILNCLRLHGGLGKDGIAARTAMTGVAVARRMAELERAGRVRRTGEKVMSTAGRPEAEWEACG